MLHYAISRHGGARACLHRQTKAFYIDKSKQHNDDERVIHYRNLRKIMRDVDRRFADFPNSAENREFFEQSIVQLNKHADIFTIQDEIHFWSHCLARFLRVFLNCHLRLNQNIQAVTGVENFFASRETETVHNSVFSLVKSKPELSALLDASTKKRFGIDQKSSSIQDSPKLSYSELFTLVHYHHSHNGGIFELFTLAAILKKYFPGIQGLVADYESQRLSAYDALANNGYLRQTERVYKGVISKHKQDSNILMNLYSTDFPLHVLDILPMMMSVSPNKTDAYCYKKSPHIYDALLIFENIHQVPIPYVDVSLFNPNGAEGILSPDICYQCRTTSEIRVGDPYIGGTVPVTQYVIETRNHRWPQLQDSKSQKLWGLNKLFVIFFDLVIKMTFASGKIVHIFTIA